jgi:hypothetical protein
MLEQQGFRSTTRSAVRNFFLGSLKIGLGLAIALGVLIAASVAYDSLEERQAKARAQKHEGVVTWPLDATVTPDLQFSIRTRLLDGDLRAIVIAKGYPEFLSHPANASAKVVFRFVDEAGFGVVDMDVPLHSLTRSGPTPDKISGLVGEAHVPLSVDRFERIKGVGFQYFIDTRAAFVPEPKVVPSAPAPALSASDNGDHCAPGLSRAERLKRLARHGTVRDGGMGSFKAGGHHLMFSVGDGSLLYCN